MKKFKKQKLPDLTEFTDEDGKKWIQTSADDLFSSKEIYSVLDSLEQEKDDGVEEIVLARIDFQKVNKEYYEAVIDLQAKLKKQNEILKKLLLDAKETIDKKNKKLKELVAYIRKLHLFVAYNKMSPEDVEKIMLSPGVITSKPVTDEKEIEEMIEEKIIEFTEVEEILLDEDGEEEGPIQ